MTETKHKEHITSEHFGIPADFADRAENYAAFRVQALSEQLAAATQLAQLNGEIAAELKADKLALEAAIEASRKQEVIAYLYEDETQEAASFSYARFDEHGRAKLKETFLYAAPVVAPDVLKDAEPDKQLCKFYSVQTFQELVEQMERHIRKLQSQLPIRQVFTNQKVREQ